MNGRIRLLRMRARHWHWRRHFIITLFCFAFGSGVAGDYRRWVMPLDLPPVDRALWYQGCACGDDARRFEAAIATIAPGGTLYITGTVIVTSTINLHATSGVTITGERGHGQTTFLAADSLATSSMLAVPSETTATTFSSLNFEGNGLGTCVEIETSKRKKR